jgi:nucleoid-associated protein YgaU
MSNRYESSTIVTNSKKIESDGNIKYVRRLSSVIYPDFRTENDTKILSQEGDRLDLLAKEFYGDERLWFVIAKANNLGKGSLDVPAGKVVVIPFYEEYSGIRSLLGEENLDR